MRTTLNLDDDVLDLARAVAAQRRLPFRRVVNEALRSGLKAADEASKARPYETLPRQMGLRSGKSLDNVQELLSEAEGETQR